MRLLPKFDPSAVNTDGTTGGRIDVGSADVNAKLLIYNQSPVNIGLDFQNGNQEVIHANEANYFVLDGDTPEIRWFVYSVLNLTGNPISETQLTLYSGSEKITGTYPISISHITNIGNPVATTVTSTQNTLTNDGNATNTQFIEATQVGSTGSNHFADNSGNFYLAEYVSSVYNKIFQVIVGAATVIKLGLSGRLVEVLGNLQVDGTIAVTGAASLDNAKITTDGSGNLGVQGGNTASGSFTHLNGGVYLGRDSFNSSHTLMKVLAADNDAHLYTTNNNGNLKITNSGQTADIAKFNDSTGFQIVTGKLIFSDGATMQKFHTFSGTGSGTFNHTNGSTPSGIQVTCSSGSGSQTMGAGNYTSTQVTITTGAGLSWTGLAYTT